MEKVYPMYTSYYTIYTMYRMYTSYYVKYPGSTNNNRDDFSSFSFILQF
jgi:hypothetical protein